jgi:hypothetical protein
MLDVEVAVCLTGDREHHPVWCGTGTSERDDQCQALALAADRFASRPEVARYMRDHPDHILASLASDEASVDIPVGLAHCFLEVECAEAEEGVTLSWKVSDDDPLSTIRVAATPCQVPDVLDVLAGAVEAGCEPIEIRDLNWWEVAASERWTIEYVRFSKEDDEPA